MSKGRTKEQRELVALAIEAGWQHRWGAKHVVLYPPNGHRPITLAQKLTGRKLANTLAQLRRAGLDIERG